MIGSDFKQKYSKTKVIEQKMKYQLNKTRMTMLSDFYPLQDTSILEDANA